MSCRIKILSENLSNKIAAGEVVERPASVVKEMVENSLDAGATEIVVEIEVGGKRLIKVSDNGCGMSREDALLALERHATSKIAVDNDLLSISTLGFRGEALPSIASVSRCTLASREKGSVEGTEIYGEGGGIRHVKARGMAEGTVIEVRNLFFNTPARLKFLKSTETEAGHVADHLTRLALSRPDVRFVYISDGRVVFRALNGDLTERIASLLGRATAAELSPMQCEDGEMRIRGLAARPECSRSAASHLYTYVNGRFVRDRVVQHAILQAYRRFLERGRYPVAVFFFSLPTGDVDVNVHPTKHEVRFREQSRVHDFIFSAVEALLQSTPWIRKPAREPVRPIAAPEIAAARKVSEVRESLGMYQAKLETPAKLENPVFREIPCRHEVMSSPVQQAAEEPEHKQDTPFFSSLTVIGQYAGIYLVCSDGEDLVLLDQHAAHERVAFERLRREFSNGSVESQGLLFPEVVEFSHAESAAVDGHLPALRKLGFVLEDFGGTARVIQSVPRMLAERDFTRVLRDLVEELSALGRSRSFMDIQEDILMRMACHSVVRGVSALAGAEIAALLTALDSVGFATNCPHGRPVFRRISRSDVEKMFKRV
jgi:DNA mismatch repair protein MutL